MQPIRDGKVTSGPTASPDVFRRPLHLADLGLDEFDARRACRVEQRSLQAGPPNAQARPIAKVRRNTVHRVQITDSLDRISVKRDPEFAQAAYRAGHQTLAARFVDRSVALIENNGL
jgi:hypothetical protein